MDIYEALADCIMNFEGWKLPQTVRGGVKGSVSWRNRNPGNLRKSPYAKGVDDKGYAIFNSLADGWNGLLFDLKAKLNFIGNTHHLTKDSTLTDLFNIYAPADDQNDPEQYSRQVALMLSHIYNSQVLANTTLDELLQLGKGLPTYLQGSAS